MNPFSVTCPTCEARLKVRNREAIGQILACPKCDSMVLVAPPPGWKDTPVETAARPPVGDAGAPVASAAQSDAVTTPITFTPAEETASPGPANSEPQAASFVEAPDATNGEPLRWPMAPQEATARKVLWWSVAGGIAAVVVAAAVGAWLLGGDDDTTSEAIQFAPIEAPPAGVAAVEPEPSLADSPAEDSALPAGEVDDPAGESIAAPAEQPPRSPDDWSPLEPATIPVEASAEPSPDLVAMAPRPEFSQDERGDDPIPPAPGEIPPPAPGTMFLGDGAGRGGVNPENSELAPPDGATDPPLADAASARPPADAAAPPPPLDEPPRDVRRIPGGSETVRWTTDPAEALEITIPRIAFRDVTLLDLSETLTSVLGSPVSLDLEGLKTLGLDARHRASADMTDATAADMLTSALAPLKLTYVPRHGQVLVTAADPTAMLNVSFKIDDLVGDKIEDAQSLGRLVQSFVAPESWEPQAGPGKLETRPGELVVTQNRNVQFELLTFLEKLRIARRLPTVSSVPADRFDMTPRRAAARQALARPVTLMFHEPTPLLDVLRAIENGAGVLIVVDWGSAGRADVTPATLLSCTLTERSSEAALSDLLGPLGLGWSAFDGRTIQVLSQEDAADRSELEFYSAPLAPGHASAQLIADLERATGGALWQSGGGAGRAYYDQPSGALVIRNTQTVQAAVAAWVASLSQ
jgi:hypothetical protein